MLCFVPVFRGCVWYIYCYVRKKAFTERGGGKGLYEVLLSMSLLVLGMKTMLANFHTRVIILLLRGILNMLVSNVSPRGPMYFRCLMFYFSGPCELLFIALCVVYLTEFVNCLFIRNIFGCGSYSVI